MCCHRVHGGRIRRAGTVPGRAASGQDLRRLQRKFGSYNVRDGFDAVARSAATEDARRVWEARRHRAAGRAVFHPVKSRPLAAPAARARRRRRRPRPRRARPRAAPRPPPPPPPPARKSDGPELDSSTKVEAELLGAAPFAVLPVLGLVGARGALSQTKKQREAEQQARIAAARAQELTPLQQKAVFGLPAVAAASLAGLFAVGPVTDALKPAPPVKGKKASTSAKGPSLSLPKLGGLELPKSKSKADPSEASVARGRGRQGRREEGEGPADQGGRRESEAGRG